ncbi:hypothetical protein [Lactococcus petauri]|uniref:hypothetical protein n=1 Tax=Lactococcus petauri TaxID=1940789 RepID=UPI0022E726D6|nr:hypothetical protein [Lactococcus petauri]
MRKRRDPVINISLVDSGARLKEVREARANKFKNEWIRQGITDSKMLKQKIKNQEETDFHEMGYSNRRYMKEMLLGNRPITEEVLDFYSKNCEISKDWLLYGTFGEYVHLVLNPLPHTVSDEDCLKVEIEARIKEITYSKSEKIVQVAEALKIIPEINGITNLVDIYDKEPNGKGLLLLLFNNYKNAFYRTSFQPVLNQMIQSVNNKQALLLTPERAYLRFVDKVVRRFDREYQNQLSISSFSQEMLLDLENEIPNDESFSPAEKKKLIPKYHKMASRVREQRNAIIKALKEEYGENVSNEEMFPYYGKWMKLITLFEPIKDNSVSLTLREKIQEKISMEEIKFALDYRNIISSDKDEKERAIKIIDEINQILEKRI